MASSGRYSKYPKVDRSIPAAPASAADRLAAAGAAPVAVQSVPAAVPAPKEGFTLSASLIGDMTVAEVLEWVGEDEDRRVAALAAEESGRARKGLLKSLGG
jgi:hypothetical protein